MKKWADIIGFEGYYKVSTEGDIFSIRSNRILKKKINVSHGYIEVELNVNSKATYHRVHRLVAMAFLSNDENLIYVNHKNGIKTDNSIENLEWISASDNNKHAIAMGLASTVSMRKKYKLYSSNEAIIFNNQKELSTATGYSIAQLATYIKTNTPLLSREYEGYYVKLA